MKKPTLEDYQEIIKPSLRQLIKEEQKLMDKIWYTRHLCLKDNKKEWDNTDADIKKVAINSAKKVEKKYGVEWLMDYMGPDSDFEWGMINGRLEMIRWVLFGHHDDLST